MHTTHRHTGLPVRLAPSARPPLSIGITLGFLMLGLAACDESSTAPEDGPPEVVALSTTAIGAFDDLEYYPGCLQTAGPPTMISDTCPVVRWKGREYWAMAYGDNRSSFAIHVYDTAGRLLGVAEEVGARYLYQIDVDEVMETVTFRGQVDRTVTLTWAELAALP